MGRCIMRIQEWMAANRLCLNADKTQVMWLGSRQRLAKVSDDPIDIDGVKINHTETAKNLGVIFDRELTLKPHLNSV